MRLTPLLLVLAACTQEKPPAAPPRPDAAPPPFVTPPPLAPVAGANAEDGGALYKKLCMGCHGGPDAAKQPFPPTDLTKDGFLCHTTVGKHPIAADADLDATFDRGPHAALKLDAVARSSLVLHLKRLAPGYAEPPGQVMVIPPETPDNPADRERGRLLYYAAGCWRCHGADGEGGGDFVKELAWAGRPLKKLRSLKDAGWLCGADPQRLFLTIAVGLGGTPAIMPAHFEMLSYFSRPREGIPQTWTRALEGRIPDADVAKVRDFITELPTRGATTNLPASEQQKRGAAFTWSIVHWLRSP
jgi:cytochrome c553